VMGNPALFYTHSIHFPHEHPQNIPLLNSIFHLLLTIAREKVNKMEVCWEIKNFYKRS